MISVVIPVLNEAGSLRQLHSELQQVATDQGYELDIILVDDGSTDESWSVIESLCQQDEQVRGVRFRRNFGKAAALSAGLAAARGDCVITMDADLQDDPREIPRFLLALDDGLDVVSGWKKRRYDPWHKVWPSRGFNWLVSRMTGVRLHDHNCGFKCYRREIFYELRLYGELHRFVPVLAAARGWRVGEIVVNHRARQFGSSKYGLLRIPKGFLDLLTVKFLTGFGQRPQHMLGMIGLGSFALGSLGILLLSIAWVVTRAFSGLEPIHLTDRALFFYCLGAALLGAQLTSIGFLAELMTALHAPDREPYSVAERIGGEAAWRTGGERSRRSLAGPAEREPRTASARPPHLSTRKRGETPSRPHE
jgi:dolichol-phosphate mannosyltransferase